MGRAAAPLDTIWPDGAEPKTLICVKVQCSAAELFDLLFVERDLSEQLHKQRGDTDLAETAWLASKDQLPAQQYTWEADRSTNRPANNLRYRKVRFESPPTALASKPFQNEEVQVITELFPDMLYVLEAVSATSAPYGDKFNVFFRYVIRHDGPSASALHLVFHVEFLPSMNRVMKPMVGRAIDAGVRGTFRIFRSVLGGVRPCADIRENELPAGPPAAYHHEHFAESEEAAEGPEVARAHAPQPLVRPPGVSVPGSGPALLSVLTQQLLYKDQVVLLADLAGAGLRSLTHSDAGAQVLAALLTVWLISLAVRALRGWQALCSGGAAAPGRLLFLAQLGVCWPLRLVDVPESTAEVLMSLALVAAINWAVIFAAQATVSYISQANPALLASLRQGGGGGGGGEPGFGGVAFGQLGAQLAAPGEGVEGNGGGSAGAGIGAAATVAGAAAGWPASTARSPSVGNATLASAGCGQGKDGGKGGGGGGGYVPAAVGASMSGTSAGGKAPPAAAAAKPSKPMRAAPAAKQFTAAQLKQLELGVVTSGKSESKSGSGPLAAGAVAAEAEALTGSAMAARAPLPSPPAGRLAKKPSAAAAVAAKEAPVPAMAAMADAWAADLPAGMVAPSGPVKRPAASPPRGGSIIAAAPAAALATAAPPPTAKAVAAKLQEDTAAGMAAAATTAIGDGGGDVMATGMASAASAAVPPVAASASISTNSFTNMFTKEGIDSMAESLRSAFRWDAKPPEAGDPTDSALISPELSASPSGLQPSKGKARSDAGAFALAAAAPADGAAAAGRVPGPRHTVAAGVSARSFGGVPYLGATLSGGVSLCSAQSDWPLLSRGDGAGEEDGGEPSVVVEEVFENERFQPFRGWGHMWPGHFLPSDRVGHWSDRQGKPGGSASMVFEQVVPQLPVGWRWLEEDWRVDLEGAESEAVDADGWTYALDFYLLKYPPPPPGGKCSLKHFVRRRRYYRTRVRADEMVSDDLDIGSDGSDGDDDGCDVSLSQLPSQEPPDLVAPKPLPTSPLQTPAPPHVRPAAGNAPATEASEPPGRGFAGPAPDAVLSLSEGLPEQPAAGGGAVSAAPSATADPDTAVKGEISGTWRGLGEVAGSGGRSAGPGWSDGCSGEAEVAERGAGGRSSGSGSSGSGGEEFVLSPKTRVTGHDPLGALPEEARAGARRGAAVAAPAAPPPALAPAVGTRAVVAATAAAAASSAALATAVSGSGQGGEGTAAAALDAATATTAAAAPGSATAGEGPPAPAGRGQVSPKTGALGRGAREAETQSAGVRRPSPGAGGVGGSAIGSASGKGGGAYREVPRPESDVWRSDDGEMVQPGVVLGEGPVVAADFKA